jgi:hypothetical protein
MTVGGWWLVPIALWRRNNQYKQWPPIISFNRQPTDDVVDGPTTAIRFQSCCPTTTAIANTQGNKLPSQSNCSPPYCQLYVATAQASLQGIINSATNSITTTLHENSKKSVMDAAESLVALVVMVAKVMFKVMSFAVQQVSGKGILEWLEEAKLATQAFGANF